MSANQVSTGSGPAFQNHQPKAGAQPAGWHGNENDAFSRTGDVLPHVGEADEKGGGHT